jgi:hypothetical protein
MTVHSSAGDAVEIETEVTSTAETAAAESQGNEDANSEKQAQSSSAEDATEETLADVIRAAVKAEEPKVPASSDGKSSEETEESKPEAKDAAEAESEAKGKDESDVPFHKHPRWQELKRERDTYKAGHEQFEQIQSFITTNGLDAKEVATGFEVMALMRQNPEKALEMLLPYVQSLELVTGRRLPEDLAQRVDDGVVDQATAQETARLRIEAERQRAHQQMAEQRQHVETQQAGVQSIQSAVRAVETEIQAGDPDYSRKQPFVMDRVRALILEERPSTPDQAVAILRRAHAEVGSLLKPMVQRKPVTTVTSGAAATSSRAEPKSLLDVVRMAAQSST